MISAIILVVGSFSAWNTSFDDSVWRWSGATGTRINERISGWNGLFAAAVSLLLQGGCLATISRRFENVFSVSCLTVWMPPCLIAKENAEGRGRPEVQQLRPLTNRTLRR
jgi:hypothetical protein